MSGRPGRLSLSAGLLIGAAFAAAAQPQYPQPYNQRPPYDPVRPYSQPTPYPQPQFRRQVPPTPRSWIYDPYTDGTVATPNAPGGS